MDAGADHQTSINRLRPSHDVLFFFSLSFFSFIPLFDIFFTQQLTRHCTVITIVSSFHIHHSLFIIIIAVYFLPSLPQQCCIDKLHHRTTLPI
jgi:hypothetical protein